MSKYEDSSPVSESDLSRKSREATMANEVLREFAKWAIRESVFAGGDLHGTAVQDKAHELGLLEKTTYNSAIHGPSDCADEGDEWLIFTDTLSSDAVAGGEPVAWRLEDRTRAADWGRTPLRRPTRRVREGGKVDG